MKQMDCVLTVISREVIVTSVMCCLEQSLAQFVVE